MASIVQYQIYQYLATHKGIPPAVCEISSAVGRSVSTTHKTLEKLKEKGFVTWEPTKCRTI
jgi:DNA-binding MarR family transcriptional regulator